MCGIAGILSDKRDVANNLTDMLYAMKHRGPDDQGTWIEEGVYLGHNRLSIIDLSKHGHQPMVSSSGRYVIVYNGEVYNFQTLRKELLAQGIKFHSNTDTEVILELWEKQGKACIHRLRGMFTFAIWDTREKRLILVRDRLGIKPIYFAQTHEGFVFASEIKGILASGLVKKELNESALASVLQKGYVQQPHTILKSVYALMPGHLLEWNNGEYSTRQFWNVEDEGQQAFASETEAISAIRTLVIKAVKEEMISDRPLGIFLSGGLDSTVLLAALRAGGVSNIKTFTVGFDATHPKLSESNDASETARYFETDHHDIQVEGDDIWKSLDVFIDALDQPSVDGLNTWLVSRETAKHVTVALSGLGGDELFSGYSIDRSIIHWRKQNAGMLKLLQASKPIWDQPFIPSALRDRLENRRKFSDFTGGYLEWGRIMGAGSAALLTGTSSKSQEREVYDIFHSFDREPSQELLQRITGMHLHTFMSSRVLRDADAVSMSHSIEVRFPLIDHRLVELAYHLPQSWRIKSVGKAARMKNYEAENSYEKTKIKHLLYQAFKQDLPPDFGKRPKKGFKLPVSDWLKAGLKDELRAICHNPNSLLDPKALQVEWEQWERGDSSWSRVWTIGVLEKWHAKFMG